MKTPKLLHNIAALGSVQAANLLVPLITLPYVTRILGVEAWGKVAFAQVILSYFALITNWGFLWSATRKVAAIRDDLPRLSTVFMATWVAQWCLALATSAILLVLIFFVPFFQTDAILYLYGIGLIISGILFPAWFFNGLERMKAVAVIQITARVVVVPCVFLFIREPSDAPLLIAFTAASGLVSGVLTILWIKRNIPLHWHIPTRLQIWEEMKDGGALFGSTIWIGLYSTFTPIILGVIAGPVAVGYYTLADRARQAAQSALVPVSQALFPRMSHLFAHDQTQAKRLFNQTGFSIAGLAAVVSLVLWLGAEPIVALLAGASFAPASVVLQWLAPLPFVVALSNLFGVQVMLPNNRNRAFNRILGVAGGLSLCIIFPLILWKGAEGAAINTFLIECFVTIAMGVYLIKNGFFSLTEKWTKA